MNPDIGIGIAIDLVIAVGIGIGIRIIIGIVAWGQNVSFVITKVSLRF